MLVIEQAKLGGEEREHVEILDVVARVVLWDVVWPRSMTP